MEGRTFNQLLKSFEIRLNSSSHKAYAQTPIKLFWQRYFWRENNIYKREYENYKRKITKTSSRKSRKGK